MDNLEKAGRYLDDSDYLDLRIRTKEHGGVKSFTAKFGKTTRVLIVFEDEDWVEYKYFN